MNKTNRYIQPSIKLINTNVDTNINYKVWIESRRAVVEEIDGSIKVGTEYISDINVYHDRIVNMGLQYNNFPQFILEITGSVLFRDLLFNINKCAQWATSLRFIHSLYYQFDRLNYPISSEYEGIPAWENQFNLFMDKVTETKITDENRVEMPYSMSAKYWISINFKTLVALLSMMKLKMPFFYNIYGKLIIEELNKHGVELEKYFTSRIDYSLAQYFRKSVFKEGYQEVDDLVVLNCKMGLLLFSQFIRQSDIIIKGFYDSLVHDHVEQFKNKVFYSGTELDITYIADKTRFLGTISNRACWFSMSSGNGINSWSNILDLVLHNTSLEDFKSLLPCEFCGDKLVNCKYRDDVKFRDEGLEKSNLPCAILNNSVELAKKRDEYDRTKLSKLYLGLCSSLTT